MADVPRDPSHYYPSDHCVQRKKERDIEWHHVSETLSNGTVKTTHKDGCRLFVCDLENAKEPVGVIAHVESGRILTVQWRPEM